MWIDDEKVVHTVAPPDWRSVIQVPEQDLTEVSDGLADALEECRAQVYRSIQAGDLGPGGPVEEMPEQPVDVPVEVFSDPGALRGFIAGVGAWWRLDVLDAIEECAEEFEQ